jgi:flagellar biosynthesis protein FliR
MEQVTLFGFPLWDAAILFARIGAILTVLPGFSEPSVPARIRLTLALVMATVMAPSLAPSLPDAPAALDAAVGLIIGEVLIGVMIGIIARILFAALATAGQIIGVETGLAFAQINDPTMTQAGQIIGVFLGVMGATMIFATGLHHEFIKGFVASYSVFKPGANLPIPDATAWAVEAVGQSFLIGIQIAAPLMMAGLVFRAGLGVLSRLAPQIQVFFVSMPLNLLGGFMIMALTLSIGMLILLDRMDQFAANLR